MMALSCFRFSDFLNGHLPPALRPSLDDDDDDDVTIAEVLESSISGSALVSLIEADEVTSDRESECSAMLTAMMRQEMEEMPRDIKSRAMRSQLRHQQQDNNALAKLPRFMLKAYEKNRQPNLRSIFASGLLLCYNPEVEIHPRTGNLVRASVVANGRNFLRKLPALLSEVTLDPKGWQAISIAEEAWKTMMRRCYNAVFDGRAAELTIQMEKVKSGEQEGDVEDVEAEIAACGLWARDRVMDKLKAASKETSSMQGNALLGLAGLIQVVVQRANQAAANDAVAAVGSGMISNQLWLLKACDTILSAVDCGYQCGSNSKPFSWCQYRSVSNTGGLTSTQIGRICAMHGMHTCVDVLYKCDVERVRALLDRFKLFLSNETLTNLHTNVHMHLTVACGRVLALLHADDRYNAITNIQTRALINTCTNAITEKGCSDENKNGAAKAADSDSNDSDDDSDGSDDEDEDFSETRLAFMTSCCVIMCQQFGSQRPDVQYTAVEGFLTIRRIVMELKDMSANYSKTLCSLLVLLTTRGWKTAALSEADFKQTLKLIEKRHKISPNDAVINECLGMLLHTFIPPDTKDVYTEKWISAISNSKIPTKQRLSALTGLAASVGSQSLHMFASSKQQTTQQVDDEHKQQIMKIVKLLTDVIDNGRDVGVTGKTVTLLSRLYLSYQVLAQSASANMPRNLCYLPDTSVMRSAFQLLVRLPSSSWRYTCIYKTFVQVAQQYTLPPVDWNATIFSKQQRSSAITDWCRYQLILTQAHENTTCASLLSSSITTAQLSNEERCLFYSNLSVFAAYSSTHDTLSALLRLVHTDLMTAVTDHHHHEKFIRAFLTGLRRHLDAGDVTVHPGYRQLQSTLRTCYDVMPVFATDELWCDLAVCVERMHGSDEFTDDDDDSLRALRLCGERVKSGDVTSSLHHHIALVLRCCSGDKLPVLAAVVASCCAVMKAEQHVTWIHHVISETRRCGDDAVMTSSLVKVLAVSVNAVSCRLDSKSSLKDFSIPYLARQPICDISMTSLPFTALNVLTQQYYGANLADDVTACMVQMVCEKRLQTGPDNLLADLCLKQAIVAIGNCGKIKMSSDLRRKVLTFMLL